MIKLSLNKAAKEAGVAKATLLEALKSGRVSASKSEKGHWEIDPSELFRVFPKTGSQNLQEPMPTPYENHTKTSLNGALEVEVKMLREQVEALASERERERTQLVDQIEDLRARLDGAESERMRLNALLTDQRENSRPVAKKSIWRRVFS